MSTARRIAMMIVVGLLGMTLATGVGASGVMVVVSQQPDTTWQVNAGGDVTTYATFAAVKTKVGALSREQVVNIQWHGVYTAFAHTSVIIFACDDADNIVATECAMDLATRANLPVTMIEARYNP